MPDPDLESRQIELEMQFSFLEEHIRQQDREILKLRDQVDKLIVELQRLREDQGGPGLSLREGERPPHY